MEERGGGVCMRWQKREILRWRDEKKVDNGRDRSSSVPAAESTAGDVNKSTIQRHFRG